jgi:hypothetical protein
MHGPLRLGAAVLAASLAVVVVAGTASAAPPEIYPLAQVKRGQTGYGVTTFAGTTPERFTFEVVSVVHNFLPKQDIVLVKSDDPKMQVSGFWQGMSGSPLYLDDKVMCAFSYGFRFNKVALGGCTPIDYMKRDGLGPVRRGNPPGAATGPASAPAHVARPAAASLADWRRLTPQVDAAAALDALGPARKSWLLAAPLPAPPSHAGLHAEQGELMTAAVPLSVAGFGAPAFDTLAKLFGDYDVTPVRAGGSAGTGAGAGAEGPREFVMGGSIAVELIRGDMSAAAVGTVSYIDGHNVLAFGHPMFQTGETYAPVSTAIVHAVIPSAQSAFVMGTPAREIGSLVQDRQAAIMADTNLRAATIPLDIAITSGTAKHTDTGHFHVEILDSKFLTPSLAGAAVLNAVNYYLPDRDDATAKIESTVRIKGHEPLSFVDYIYANDGAGSVMGGVRGLRVLVPLMLNPYAPVTVESIELKVDLRYEANFGEIKELRVPTTELIAGKRNLVSVVMDTWNGQDLVEDVPVDVPAELAGSIVQLEISAGDSAKLDAAPPVDLPSLLAAFRHLLPGTVWAATIYPGDEGVAVEGKVVRDLPASVVDKLRPQSHTQRVAAYRPIARTLSPARRVVNGGGSILVRVRAAR